MGGGVNMPEIWQRFISKADLGNKWGYLFHIAHTYPSGDADVHFGINELWPTTAIITLICLISGSVLFPKPVGRFLSYCAHVHQLWSVDGPFWC